jgi:hypothetical protein
VIYWIVALLYYRILRIGGHGDSQPKLRVSYYAEKRECMKLIKVQIELGIDDGEDFYQSGEKEIQSCYPGLFSPVFDKEKIANYLNNKLYMDPEFFGEFGPENIIEVREFE